ncbi:MAG: 16S rRNA (uracil(1498)-N(3))-methyltransferase [Gemmatimonadaceae bacterium]|nr:16S rRNA (uracil(1498)-N(3))-methyltransferase [Gemmatimonadaceae bacterium]
MERVDSPSVATFYTPGAWSDRVELDEAAAHHAHVKRLVSGDPVQLSSGEGRLASGVVETIGKRRLVVAVDMATLRETTAPSRMSLWTPIGDRDRMLWLAEKCTEIGLWEWSPVSYRRSRSVSPRGEGDAFAEKVRLRMIAALEQSGGAWLPRVLPERALSTALADIQTPGVLLDANGRSIRDVLPGITAPLRIALGPEGGLEPEEREQFVRAGWTPVSLADNVLRFETAAIAAVANFRVHLG